MSCFANKRTPPSNAFNCLLRSLSQSALGVTLRWNLRRNLLDRCVLQCSQGGEIIFLWLDFSCSWSGKMRKMKKDTNARVAGQTKQTKKAQWSKCAWIIFQWISLSPTRHWYRTQCRFTVNIAVIAVKFPNFLENLSLLLTRSFCPLDTIAIASSVRPTFVSSLIHWSMEFSVVHVYF